MKLKLAAVALVFAAAGFFAGGGIQMRREWPTAPFSYFFRIQAARTVWAMTRSRGADYYSQAELKLPESGHEIDLALSLPPSKMTAADRAAAGVIRRAENMGLMDAIATASAAVFLVVVSHFILRRRAATSAKRGLAKNTRAQKHQIEIAGVPLPTAHEARGVLLCGAPGSGKSQVISAVVSQVRARGDGCVTLDRGCERLPQSFRPCDFIFNPLDSRGVDWSPLAEIATEMDAETLASMIWPRGGEISEAGDYFRSCAAHVFVDVVWRGDVHSNAALLSTLSCPNRLSAAIAGTASEQFAGSREWGGIYTTMMAGLTWLKYLLPAAGRAAFAFRDVVGAVAQGRGLWIAIPKIYAAVLNPLAGVAIGLLAHSALSLPPGDRRIFLITDELGNLPRLGHFSAALAEGRKHGLAVVSAVQSIAQLRRIYGLDGAQELMSCYSTWLILRTGDAESAEAMSRHLGEVEVTEWRQSRGRGSTAAGATQSSGQSEQVRLKRTILPRALQELPDLHGYLSLAGFAPARVTVPIFHERAGNVEPFVPRSFSLPIGPAAAPAQSGNDLQSQEAIPGLDLAALDKEGKP